MNQERGSSQLNGLGFHCFFQWLFLVPLKGGRWHIIQQLAVYTTYILPSGGLYATYHLLGEPETTTLVSLFNSLQDSTGLLVFTLNEACSETRVKAGLEEVFSKMIRTASKDEFCCFIQIEGGPLGSL